ncbi:MAG: 50S ribosomal protein L19 [Candidatus Omnitrophica bacterium]|nr:50S ribosomal protein L19 [Candidatus Omnitrophota bacterium]
MVATNAQKDIKHVEEKFLRKELPDFNVGDTIKMKVKVREADKVRLHPFEGTVISKTGRGLKGSFTVRKVSFGEGVERIFPLHSPVIESLHVVSKGVSQRSKLYYLRGRTGKSARLKKELGVETPAQTQTVPARV